MATRHVTQCRFAVELICAAAILALAGPSAARAQARWVDPPARSLLPAQPVRSSRRIPPPPAVGPPAITRVAAGPTRARRPAARSLRPWLAAARPPLRRAGLVLRTLYPTVGSADAPRRP
ncbi:hypothetical protein M446_2937 [Methylobacterium sp. 4-46]|uniref:hypothetical protein n=1 Tax=unclassified Methylobacterium TaxID=2615210 RepID=UPI000165CABC|nr:MULTISPECIES: hypothetical protein [Methylobacterium]ACA17349.1 hypothetical protein M446_2937 [Methylobacterium sp. 4-46]WFT83036.1 hypothetical protein QA634_14910 [Methylobacterium nodulans]